ncbi:hypothetical protein D3C76_691470 [compost metagenome]
MVGERHAHFEAGRHAQAVLAVEQDRQPALQVHVAEFAHAPLLWPVTGQVLDAVHGLVVATVLVVDEVAQPVEIRVDQLGLQQLHARQPREALRCHGLRVTEPGIAAKHLVRRLAGDRHRGMAADGLEQQVQRGVHIAEGGGTVIGAVHRQARGCCAQLAVVDEDGLVLAADVVRRRQGIGLVPFGAKRVALEVLGLADEIDRERIHRAALLGAQALLRQRGEQGRVQPAGEQRTDWHVGVQLLAQRLAEQRAGALDGGRLIVQVLAPLHLPVTTERHLAVRSPGQPMARRQLADTAQGGTRRTTGQAQGIHQTDHIQGAGKFAVSEDRLDLRAEQQPLLMLSIIKWLDPQAVAHQQQVTVAPIEHGEGKHAIQVFTALLAPFQISVQHHFGVAAGEKVMAGQTQTLAQRLVVVDLAGIDQRHLVAIGKAVGHRLHATVEVEDRQPPVAQQGIALPPTAAGVRAAQGQGIGHGSQHVAVLGQLAGVVHPACDSAHGALLKPEDGG